MDADNHSMDTADYIAAVSDANVRCRVRRAILDRFNLQPDILKGKWRRKCTELTRKYQRAGCLPYERAEAMAFEDVLCMLWLS